MRTLTALLCVQSVNVLAFFSCTCEPEAVAIMRIIWQFVTDFQRIDWTTRKSPKRGDPSKRWTGATADERGKRYGEAPFLFSALKMEVLCILYISCGYTHYVEWHFPWRISSLTSGYARFIVVALLFEKTSWLVLVSWASNVKCQGLFVWSFLRIRGVLPTGNLPRVMSVTLAKCTLCSEKLT